MRKRNTSAALLAVWLGGWVCLAGGGVSRLELRPVARADAPAAPDASGPLSTPVLGFAPGVTGNELWPLVGIPGAAHIGPAVRLPETVTRVRVAPGGGYALAEQDPDTPMGIATLAPDGGAATVTPIAGALATADLVVFSPAGSAAVLYFSSAGRFQVLAGLPDAPRVVRDLTAGALGIAPGILAVSDDAAAVLAGDAAGGVYLLPAEGAPALLYQSNEVSALAFLPGRQDAVMADRTQNRVVLLQQVSGACAAVPLAAEESGVDRPDLLAGAGGQAIVIASTGSRRMWVVDAATSSLTAFDLPVVPTRLEPARGGNTFLLSAEADEPAWLFTWQAGSGTVFFVPNSRPDPGSAGDADSSR